MSMRRPDCRPVRWYPEIAGDKNCGNQRGGGPDNQHFEILCVNENHELVLLLLRLWMSDSPQ